MIFYRIWEIVSILTKFMVEIMIVQLILLIFLLIIFYSCLQLLKFLVRQLASYQMPHLKAYSSDQERPVIVGFFHPYCNAGGGGERVLWESIKAIQGRYNHVRCVIYTGDSIDIPRSDVLARVITRFNIHLPRTDPLSLSFIPLQTIKLVEASTYPHFTLIGQSLGSVFLGFEALFKLIPDVYIDSMGYAFTYPLFKHLAGRSVACYVHYPTISSDMLQAVSERQDAHNNTTTISSSFLLSHAKLIYYKMFALSYGWVGRFSDVVMVNSTWTRNHVVDIWKSPSVHLVYPPCNVEDFLKLPINETPTSNSNGAGTNGGGSGTNGNGGNGGNGGVKYITSIAQFRPEKNHKLQLTLFKAFVESLKKSRVEMDVRQQLRLNHLKSKTYKLLLVGSCRGVEDEGRVEELRGMVEEMGLGDLVQFRLNVTFDELKEILNQTTVGLHTMWNEHFGIGVVECMAAGMVVVAHNSGGPKSDIIVEHEGQKTGFLASDEKTYSETLADIFCLSDEERMRIKLNARASVRKFSDAQFDAAFVNLIHPLIAPL